MAQRDRLRDQRGVVFPSPVVILSAVAVAMAGIAFVATRDSAPDERAVPTSSVPSASATATTTAPAPAPTPTKRPAPKVDRAKVYVVVFNNSNVTGLAGKVAAQATQIGWQVVGTDNWYGTIPTSTVYYPQRMERAAKQLALDLGIQRTAPAVDPMRLDRLTVILTGAVS